MDTHELLDALLALAGRLQVPIREESFDKVLFAELGERGGLCTLGGERVILVDRDLGPTERVGVLLRALAGLPLDRVHMPPYVRERLEVVQRARAAILEKKRPRLRIVKPR